MGKQTGISWTDHSFNPWVGCTKISPACDHCYAESWAKRAGTPELWQGERRRTARSNWSQPRRWNAEAAAARDRRRVFCASLADVFDNQVPEDWRADLWQLIRATPNLDWLLLTKRPQLIKRMLPPDWELRDGDGKWQPCYPNVWLGTTVENRETAGQRLPHLLSVRASVHFISAEPLLETVNLRQVEIPGAALLLNALSGYYTFIGTGGIADYAIALNRVPMPISERVEWVIIGGESGPGARRMVKAEAEYLIFQCREEGVPVFFKQTGSNRGEEWPAGITGKGDDPSQWPEHMRIQEFLA